MAERKYKQKDRTEEIKKAIEGDGRILPNNFDAEQAVLGCALIDSEATLTVVSKLDEVDFYNETHRNIFKIIKELFSKSVSVDIVTVSDELEKISPEGIW